MRFLLFLCRLHNLWILQPKEDNYKDNCSGRARCSNMSKPGKDDDLGKYDDSRDWMGGSVLSTFRGVQTIHEVQIIVCFFYAIITLSFMRFFTRIMIWKRCLKRSCVTLILCFYFYSCSDGVMVHSIYHAYLRKHCHLTAILSRRRIFSKELLLCEIPAIIWYSNFMTSKEAYHSSFQPWQHYLNIFK